MSTSDFLPALEKEKLPRLFKDFPDFKNRHSSEPKSRGGGWGGSSPGAGHLAPGGRPASPQRRVCWGGWGGGYSFHHPGCVLQEHAGRALIVGDRPKHRTHSVPPGASGDPVGQVSPGKLVRDEVLAVSVGGRSQGYLPSSPCRLPEGKQVFPVSPVSYTV